MVPTTCRGSLRWCRSAFVALILASAPIPGGSAVISLVESDTWVGGAIVQRPDASFALTWGEGPLADGSSALRFRRFGASGVPLAETVTIDQGQLDPIAALAGDAFGNELFVYFVSVGSGENRHMELRLRGVSFAGVEIWPTRLLAEISGPLDFIGPTTAVAAPDGGWIVVWAEYRHATVSSFELFSCHVALSDGAISPRRSVATPGQLLPVLSLASDGTQPLVVWRQESTLGGDLQLVARSLDGAGIPIGTVVELLAHTDDSILLGQVGVDAIVGGSYFVYWPQSATQGWTDLLGLTYSPGAPPPSPVHLFQHQALAPFVFSLTLAVDQEGRAMVSWIETPPDNAYPTTILRQGWTVSGIPLTSVATVATYVGLTTPAVYMTDSGSWIVTWTKQPQPAPGVPGSILAEIGAFRNECEPSPTALCLAGGRFRATATYHDHLGRDGVGQAVALTPESGTFWFFTPANVELILKVVDACGHPDFHDFWVYASGLTDVEVTLTVVDTWTGEIWERETSLGEPFPPILDSQAFHTCETVPIAGPVAQVDIRR